MAFTEPVLLKRIPQDPAQRKTVWYDDYVATGGYASLRKAMDMAPDAIIKTVTDSGLRGRGGAGFSAGQKWSFVPREKKGPHYLAVNADESEPGTFKDRYLIDYDPHSMLGHRHRRDGDAVRRRLHLHPRGIPPAGEGARARAQGGVRQQGLRAAGDLRQQV